MRNRRIYILLGVAAMFLLAAILTGCGDSGSPTAASTAPQCDPSAPSIIPPPSGRPQLVEFYRDT